jgi:hypothetical protein
LDGDDFEMKRQTRWYLLVAIVAMLTGLAVTVAWASTEDTAATPDWLEPRGLSVIELVGQVPDTYLQGTILSYGDWAGIVVYESGTRTENTVVVRTIIYPRYTVVPPNDLALTMFGCLGQTPHYDHMGSVVPSSTLRVYDSSGREVTAEITYMRIARMDTQLPTANSSYPFRYPQVDFGLGSPNPLPIGPNGLSVPANSGCWIRISGANYYPLTGVFTLNLEPSVRASVLGTQQGTFQSYIGPGGVGIFQPLMSQLRKAYPDRHGRIPLNIPARTNYFVLKFPPMPGDPYTDAELPYRNAGRLSAGTYRLSGTGLSTDMVFSAAFPVQTAWRDADQAPGSKFLPVMANLPELAPLEYVLPAGIAWNSCFTQGNCPSDILRQIHDAVMSLEIVYLSVSKPASGGEWVSLQMAGPAWSPTNLGGSAEGLDFVAAPDTSARAAIAFSETSTSTHRIFLPFVSGGSREELPTGCPCGWFDPLGRMLGFWPGPAATRQQ